MRCRHSGRSGPAWGASRPPASTSTSSGRGTRTGYRLGQAITHFHLAELAGEAGLDREKLGRLAEAERHFQDMGAARFTLAVRHERASVPEPLVERAEQEATWRAVWDADPDDVEPQTRIEAGAALALRGLLQPGALRAACAALWSRLGVRARVRAHYALWQVEASVRDLEAAAVLVDALRRHAPQEARESVVQCVRLHREVLAAYGNRKGPKWQETRPPAGDPVRGRGGAREVRNAEEEVDREGCEEEGR